MTCCRSLINFQQTNVQVVYHLTEKWCPSGLVHFGTIIDSCRKNFLCLIAGFRHELIRNGPWSSNKFTWLAVLTSPVQKKVSFWHPSIQKCVFFSCVQMFFQNFPGKPRSESLWGCHTWSPRCSPWRSDGLYNLWIVQKNKTMLQP